MWIRWLAPGASHLIHMASHTYIHVGRYEDVGALNARALEVDAAHARATDAPGVLGSPDYYPHNLSFGMAGAMMSGDGPLAVKFADDAKAAFPPGGRGDMDYIFARVMSAYGRYAPDRALQLPQPKAGDTLGVAMWRYARGEALASRGDGKAVAEESRQIGQALAAKDAAKMGSFARTQAELAQRVLEGRATPWPCTSAPWPSGSWARRPGPRPTRPPPAPPGMGPRARRRSI